MRIILKSFYSPSKPSRKPSPRDPSYFIAVGEEAGRARWRDLESCLVTVHRLQVKRGSLPILKPSPSDQPT